MDTSLDPRAFTDHIVEEFHEEHRRVLPGLVKAARNLTHERAIELHERLQRMADELELHMFMEEMRLFPMMVQGGHVLLDALVEDICAEHDVQSVAIKELQSLAQIMGNDPACAPVVATLEHFLARLREHIRVEEEELIPLFRDH